MYPHAAVKPSCFVITLSLNVVNKFILYSPPYTPAWSVVTKASLFFLTGLFHAVPDVPKFSVVQANAVDNSLTILMYVKVKIQVYELDKVY